VRRYRLIYVGTPKDSRTPRDFDISEGGAVGCGVAFASSLTIPRHFLRRYKDLYPCLNLQIDRCKISGPVQIQSGARPDQFRRSDPSANYHRVTEELHGPLDLRRPGLSLY
jgi:hypothetical protein